jgi:CO/xanthine dehydrogenase FAD-binding subunit
MPDTTGDTKYFAPSELREALGILDQHANITVLAGGTDLVPKMNYGEHSPEGLLYIGKLGLDYIKEKDGTLLIGAATPVDRLLSNALVAARAPVLVDAARLFASFAVRTSATVGGNIANASPAADLIPPLIALDASLRLASAAGERTVAVQDYCTGPGETLLRPGELILEIAVPPAAGHAVFMKLGRRKAQTLAVMNVVVRLEMDGATCQDARIVLGAMAPTPLRCTQAEALIRGKSLDAGLIADCAARAIAESAPITDQRGSAWYRKEAGTALLARALTQAAGLEG